MLELIYDYEFTRFQLQKRIYELTKSLQSRSLRTMEREKLLARRDVLSQERTELLEMILEMQAHLGKEELNYVKNHPCSGKNTRYRPELCKRFNGDFCNESKTD